ncbi:error-prone DNA polymerase [Pilimelia anulata]|uniref:Error-prone DNA polymerase n=1 Tax=Pilimelia anulata TaxID=53371 RepID=A0A8J3F867_9ACTN|nr:error-prone DNA polymerase [Pilimelia anulata]GGJ85403.1 error-prone DNA polymerase [Pilimelia anulata]
MGWNNPAVPWTEWERRLDGRVVDPLADADGGDGPGFTRKRGAFEPPPVTRPANPVPYAELHAHSNFSFLDGASHPHELAVGAERLGLTALAITDHDSLAGVVRFSEAAERLVLRTVFGSELSVELDAPRAGPADPPGRHLLALARGPAGYAKLAASISLAQLAGGEKGRPRYPALPALAEQWGGEVLVLTGCRKGHVPAALRAGGPAAAAAALDRLVAAFGRDGVVVELTAPGDPTDDEYNDTLAALAADRGLRAVATGNVHYATPADRRLATVLAAIRARRSLDELDGWLPAAATAHLRDGAEMARRFAAYPGAVAGAAALGAELAFDLKLVAPRLPVLPMPPGCTEASRLRELARAGVARRYRYGPLPPPGHERDPYARVEGELALIEELGFPGYFLIVRDIVAFCRERNIYCQGRGSAANSVLCYALGITNVDPMQYRLLFERFLSRDRPEPPDIDIDIESGRREEVIQYVYDTYGRHHTAQVANVISYRPRSAIRDVARAFGHSPGRQDAWSKRIDRWHGIDPAEVADVPADVVAYASRVQTFPRHLGIHSGGMVICDRPVIEVCPVEWARMPGRSVLQWDKDDCAAIKLIKFDLLGLGMLGALHDGFDLIGGGLDLTDLQPDDPQVYEMLCRADAVGVFQVESRAQLATLPRLRPKEFYDLVVEVALIRPGPIQGGSVHPYIKRRNGATWSLPHESMGNALNRTYGVPLFQEQMMQLAIDTAGFDGGTADELRRAMGSKRSSERMERLRTRLYDGMAAKGIPTAIADDIFHKLLAFASFGFPESHALSFAFLVYASAWLKRYHPAAFCAALLNNQPMGFYAPQSLVDDARRHGVRVRRPEINASGAGATLEYDAARRVRAGGPAEPPERWGAGGPVLRQGLSGVRTVGGELAGRIVAERAARGPYRSIADLARRTAAPAAALEALATVGAFRGFGLTRRAALWQAGAAAAERPDRLPLAPAAPPPLPGMSALDDLVADVWATGLSPETHPVAFLRERLAAAGAVSIAGLAERRHGERLLVGGMITHRQRPATAGGITFLNLEDETGMLNVVCSPGLWLRYRAVARSSPGLLIRGTLERQGEVLNLVAERLAAVAVPARIPSRDFR